MNIENENRLKEFPFGVQIDFWTGEPALNKDGETEGLICECSDGWADVIYNLCKELNDLYIENGLGPENIQVMQIKEKFGGLRFYTNGLTEEGYEIIDKYKDLSYKTCELCGEPGKLRNTRWNMTLCDKCHDENNHI